MSLKGRFIIYSLLLHGIIAYFLYLNFSEEPIYFVLVQFLILLSFGITIGFFERMMQPSRIASSGENALKDKDYTVKFVEQGAIEVDRLVKLYNAMIDELRSERLRAEEQSQFLHKMIASSPVGIIILNYDNEIESINAIACRQCAMSIEVIGQKLASFDSELIQKIIKLPKNASHLITLDDQLKFKCQVMEIIHQGFIRDFIMIEELTAELLKSEKNAYGKVIRMMAHEVNNASGAVSSILSTIIDYGLQEDADPDTKKALEVAIERNAGLGKFIDNFAQILRLPLPNKRHININEFLPSVIFPWASKAKEINITIESDLDSAPFYLEADPTQLDRVISNALKNALESIEINGAIKVTTNSKAKTITILDNGPGIPEHIKSSIFTPFFSTKTNGQGIGLMLSKEIIQKHDGLLTLKTDIETGWTAFRIKF